MANIGIRRADAFKKIVAEHNKITTLVNELKVRVGEARTLANELRTIQATNLTMMNELKADMNGLLAKLDLDAGVTDTNYAALRTIAAADIAAVTSPAVSAVAAADANTLVEKF